MKPVKQGKKQGGATSWKPGTSGNPKGRPKNESCLTSLMRAKMDQVAKLIDPVTQEPYGKTWKELIVLATLKLALEGNHSALKEVWERMEGKVVQPVNGSLAVSIADVLAASFGKGEDE